MSKYCVVLELTQQFIRNRARTKEKIQKPRRFAHHGFPHGLEFVLLFMLGIRAGA